MPLLITIKKFTELRGMLESILQSKNPLETALFAAQSGKKQKNERALWNKLLKELATCYHPKSLAKFKDQLTDIKQDLLQS